MSLKHNYPEKILSRSDLKNCIYLIISILESLNPAYLQHTYLYEKRIRDAKAKVMSSIFRLSAHQQSFAQLYASILDCGQIRWREKDPHIFAMCKSELQVLIQHLENLPKRGHDVANYFNTLRDTILTLEDTYHHVLKVSAKDPMLFIIFIENMKNLCNLLEQFF